MDTTEHTFEESYAQRKKRADSSYGQITVGVIVTCAVGVAVAIVTDVLIGTALCIVSAFVYRFFSTDDIYKELGLRCESVQGRIHIRHAVAIDTGVSVIPSRLLWCDVTAICDGAFASGRNAELSRIYLPKSIELIGNDLFGNLDIHPEIYYEGTKEEWLSVKGVQSLECSAIFFSCPQPTAHSKSAKACDEGGSDI